MGWVLIRLFGQIKLANHYKSVEVDGVITLGKRFSPGNVWQRLDWFGDTLKTCVPGLETQPVVMPGNVHQS